MRRNILQTIPDKDCPPLHLGSGPVTRITVPRPVLRAVPFTPPGLFAVWLKRKGDSMKLTISTILQGNSLENFFYYPITTKSVPKSNLKSHPAFSEMVDLKT